MQLTFLETAERKFEMRCKPFLLLCSFLAVLVFSHSARADILDSFTLVGDGHTLSWSLPDGVLLPDYFYRYFFESAPGTIDGISGYTVGATYTVTPISFNDTTSLYLILSTSIYGSPDLPLSGPLFTRPSYVPVTDPFSPFKQYVVASFNPGIYALQAYLQNGPPIDFTLTISQQTVAATPEPTSLVLLGTGAFSSFWVFARRSGSECDGATASGKFA